jgi:hypothetical protein
LNGFEFEIKDVWDMKSLVNQGGGQGNYLSGQYQVEIAKENYLVPNKL